MTGQHGRWEEHSRWSPAKAVVQMNGPHCVKSSPTFRIKSKKIYPTLTTLTLSCVVILVIILFWVGHSSVMRMHTAIHSPSMEQPAGWATLHKTTTVQSATVTISGSEITGSALTATTTETQAASEATATAAESIAESYTSSGFPNSLAHMLGDLQHSLHAMLRAHAGWKPGDKITRAQLAAAAAASMPDAERDIELHPHKVAEVVGGSKVAQQLQKLALGRVTALLDGGHDERTSSEAFAGLYGAGGGTVAFSAAANLAACPEGSPSLGAAQAAAVLMAGSSTAALQRSLDGLILLYSKASLDVRSAFHLYIAIDSSSSEEIRHLATTYVHDTMGAVKLVQLSSSSDGNRSSSSGDKDITPAEHNQADAGSLHVGTAATAQRLLLTGIANSHKSSAGANVDPQPQAGGQDKQLYRQDLQQSESHQQPREQHSAAVIPPSSKISSSSFSMDPQSSHKINHLLLLLHVFFKCFKYPAVLLLEDDLKLAPDFFNFFHSTNWLLGSDPSLYCLAAWNPQGHRQHVVHPTRLLRTDSNPGKAWLLSRRLGLQLLSQWQQHDQERGKPSGSSGSASHIEVMRWLSSSAVREHRQCLVPELPRVVPAGADETFASAHTQEPHAADKSLKAGRHQVLLTAADYITNTSPLSNTESSRSSSSSFGEEGSVDFEAYLEYEADGSDELTVVSDAIQVQMPVLQLQDGPSPSAGNAEGYLKQQQLDPSSQGTAYRAAWLHKDLSIVLARNYEAVMHQALLKAQISDVARAATITDIHVTCVVTYNSAASLSATAVILGIPVVLEPSVKYCYPLPATATVARQHHCQDFMPEMAYHGIVSGYNQNRVRVFLVHDKFMEALQQVTKSRAA